MTMYRVAVTETDAMYGFFEADNLEKAKELLNAVIEGDLDRTDLPKWDLQSLDYFADYEPNTLREAK